MNGRPKGKCIHLRTIRITLVKNWRHNLNHRVPPGKHAAVFRALKPLDTIGKRVGKNRFVCTRPLYQQGSLASKVLATWYDVNRSKSVRVKVEVLGSFDACFRQQALGLL